jgi:hypothetical protein
MLAVSMFAHISLNLTRCSRRKHNHDPRTVLPRSVDVVKAVVNSVKNLPANEKFNVTDFDTTIRMIKIFVGGSWKRCETTERQLSVMRDSGKESSAGCETTGSEAE